VKTSWALHDPRPLYRAKVSKRELHQIAMGMVTGTVYTDRHCRSPEDLRASFMHLCLAMSACPDFYESYKTFPPGLVYEHLNAAGPMAVNGQPIFMSSRFLSPDHTATVMAMCRKLEKMGD